MLPASNSSATVAMTPESADPSLGRRRVHDKLGPVFSGLRVGVEPVVPVVLGPELRLCGRFEQRPTCLHRHGLIGARPCWTSSCARRSTPTKWARSNQSVSAARSSVKTRPRESPRARADLANEPAPLPKIAIREGLAVGGLQSLSRPGSDADVVGDDGDDVSGHLNGALASLAHTNRRGAMDGELDRRSDPRGKGRVVRVPSCSTARAASNVGARSQIQLDNIGGSVPRSTVRETGPPRRTSRAER